MRFFHRFESLNYKYLALVNGILLSAKRKSKYTRVLEYLDKYSYVLNDIKPVETSDKYNGKIWQLWLQGEENMPPIVKKCTDSVKKYHGEDVILLTSSNLSQYVQLPDYIEEKYRKGIISHANYSDMIRFSLLAKYGGCWVDSTILLTNKIPDDILNSRFFAFRSFISNCLKDVNSIEQFKIFSNFANTTISIESPYFLKSDSGSILINAVLSMFFEYWKHEEKLVDYLMIDKCFILAVLHNELCRKEFLSMPEYYLENVLLLQSAQFEKFKPELFEEIKKLSPIHKMTHKNLHVNPYKDSLLMHILENNSI